jgi:hypothetical protein
VLAPHARFYVREMRIRAYAQLLESYRSLTLESMCRAFGVGEEFMDKSVLNSLFSPSSLLLSCLLSCVVLGEDGRTDALIACFLVIAVAIYPA